MATNSHSFKPEKIIYPELSYLLTGLLFAVHNELGRYAREKQYADLLEAKLKQLRTAYKREIPISNSGNVIDFIVEDNIILELKAVPMLNREHYRQIQNYLHQTQIKLGLLVNFHSQYLKPVRCIRID